MLDGFIGTDFPSTVPDDLEILGRIECRCPYQVEHSQLRVIACIFQLFLIIVHPAPAFYGHFHVGLSRTEPDISGHHVVQYRHALFPLTVGNGDLERPACWRSVDLHRPFPVSSGNAFVSHSIPGCHDLDGGSRLRLAPYGDFAVPLQDHVVRE